MRHLILVPAMLASGLALSACSESGDETVERAFQDVNVVDETDLNDVMLTVADPNEAVDYFARASKSNPDRIDLPQISACMLPSPLTLSGPSALP